MCIYIYMYIRMIMHKISRPTVDGWESLRDQKDGWNHMNNESFTIYQLVQDVFITVVWISFKFQGMQDIMCFFFKHSFDSQIKEGPGDVPCI